MAASIRGDIRTLPNVITLLRIVILCLGVVVYFYLSHAVGIALAILVRFGIK